MALFQRRAIGLPPTPPPHSPSAICSCHLLLTTFPSSVAPIPPLLPKCWIVPPTLPLDHTLTSPTCPQQPESVHVPVWPRHNLALNAMRHPYIVSQSGRRRRSKKWRRRRRVMPGGLGINLSPHHSCFLLLSACLIKLHHRRPPTPSATPPTERTQTHFSINSLYHSCPPPALFSPFHPLLKTLDIFLLLPASHPHFLSVHIHSSVDLFFFFFL